MIQETSQATAQAIAQLTAYAPTLLADNAERYPIVLITTLITAIFFTIATWKLAQRCIATSKNYDTEGASIAFFVAATLAAIIAGVCFIVFFDLLTYINHPEIWALKDLVSAATH